MDAEDRWGIGCIDGKQGDTENYEIWEEAEAFMGTPEEPVPKTKYYNIVIILI